MKNYDYEALRRDLLLYIEGLSFHGDEIAKSLYLDKVEKANDEKLKVIAKECNFTLKDYEIESVLKEKR